MGSVFELLEFEPPLYLDYALTIQLPDMSGNPMPTVLVRYLRHVLNNRPVDELTVLDHFNTKLFAIQIPTVLILFTCR